MAPVGIDLLTERECEVLRLVHDGRSSKEIAIELNLSPNTVDVYVKRAMEKLGLRSRLQAAASLHAYESTVSNLVSQPDSVATSVESNEKPASKQEDALLFRRLPFFRNGRRTNDLTLYQRLLWIGLGAVLLMTLFAQLSNGISAIESIAAGFRR